jgi:tetratricopeptide (TPR) repeat protein
MILSSLLFAIFLIEEPIRSAQTQFDNGNYKAALNTLSAAVVQSPNEATLHYWIARCHYEMGQYDQAINHSELAVKLDPKNAEYNRWLGRAYGAKAEQSRSFFLARRVKQAFEAAVRLAPGNIAARRDLMQYCAEAPWIVGGDKGQAREQIAAIAAIDPLEGQVARAAYLATDKQWNAAEAEYISIIDKHPAHIQPYMEAAEFFAERKDDKNLQRALEGASRVNPNDPRLGFYRAVSLILRKAEIPTAEQLLLTYLSVPERSDYPSHRSAQQWLGKAGK